MRAGDLIASVLGALAWLLVGYLLMRYGRRIAFAIVPGPDNVKVGNAWLLRFFGFLMLAVPVGVVIYAAWHGVTH